MRKAKNKRVRLVEKIAWKANQMKSKGVPITKVMILSRFLNINDKNQLKSNNKPIDNIKLRAISITQI